MSQGTSPFYFNFNVIIYCLHSVVGRFRTKIAATNDGIHCIEKISFVLRFKMMNKRAALMFILFFFSLSSLIKNQYIFQRNDLKTKKLKFGFILLSLNN